MKNQKKTVVLAFDEFQQISDYTEKNVEALLRTYIQQMTATRMIFSGSIKHILSAIFSGYNRPFYQSTQLLTLSKIENKILFEILTENEEYYYTYRNLVTKHQFLLLRAIGKEDGVHQPSSKKFIDKYKLGTTSTVSSSIKSLLSKDLIFVEDDKYVIYDVFFSLWLKYFT